MKLLRMTFSASLRALRRNKMRSALTILGMVIGVAAVITTVGIGQGATRAIESQIASMGNDLLVVMPGTQRRGGANSGWGGASSLTLDDARAIEREASFVDQVSYMRSGAVQLSPNPCSGALARCSACSDDRNVATPSESSYWRRS